jgi:hypothetical protein
MSKKREAVVEITLTDIYNILNEFSRESKEVHEELLIHAAQTNGKVKTNRVLLGALSSAMGVMAVWLFSHVSGSL